MPGKKGKACRFSRAQAGGDIQLALDLGAQRLASELMAGRVGAVFAMDVYNGNVKVLFSSPGYDANPLAWGISSREWNELTSDPVKPMMNRVIAGTYPPASTFKIVPAFAALAEGVINRRTTFVCSGGMRVGKQVFQVLEEGRGSRVDECRHGHP